MSGLPSVKGFFPFGAELVLDGAVILALEEYESIKLADYEGLSQEEASVKMGISRPTFTRIYEEARKKIAKSLVEGKSFVIEGGNVYFDFESLKCRKCGNAFKLPQDKMEKPISCPKCQSKNLFLLNDFYMNGCPCRKGWF